MHVQKINVMGGKETKKICYQHQPAVFFSKCDHGIDSGVLRLVCREIPHTLTEQVEFKLWMLGPGEHNRLVVSLPVPPEYQSRGRSMPSPFGAELCLCHDFMRLLQPEDVRKSDRWQWPVSEHQRKHDRAITITTPHIIYIPWKLLAVCGARQSYPVYVPHRGSMLNCQLRRSLQMYAKVTRYLGVLRKKS